MNKQINANIISCVCGDDGNGVMLGVILSSLLLLLLSDPPPLKLRLVSLSKILNPVLLQIKSESLISNCKYQWIPDQAASSGVPTTAN